MKTLYLIGGPMGVGKTVQKIAQEILALTASMDP